MAIPVVLALLITSPTLVRVLHANGYGTGFMFMKFFYYHDSSGGSGGIIGED